MKLSVTVRHVIDATEWLDDMAVDEVDTDDPEAVLEWLEEWKELSYFETGRSIEVLA